MTAILGHNFIGGARSAAGTLFLQSLDAASGEALPYRFVQATPEEVDAAAEAAASAYPHYRQLPASRRAEFLDTIAAELDALDDDFVAIVCRETALPATRIQGERSRTSGQLRLFAEVLRRGDFHGARIDRARPERKPLPRVDLRQCRIGLGPVAVFGASNFPLAFSTAGGDTAAALAAGCPVVFKAHSGHMATAERVAAAILRAAERTGMPAGVFNMIYGGGVGERLVRHPAIQAGCGQFCTNPGLVIGIRSAQFSAFLERFAARMDDQPAQTMLNAGTLASYEKGLAALHAHPRVRHLAGQPQEGRQARPQLFQADVSLLLEGDELLQEEVFGPASVVVEVADHAELKRALHGLHGQLTATLIAEGEDLASFADLVPLLEQKAGRLLLNGYPTGVEVCDAMVHGGPYPATSDARGTSVGTLAIDRFLRPVCYQNYPDAWLPEALKDGNPLGIARLVDGIVTRAAVA
ncbi:aldehyde dehydrogenase (NADP(+)) [Pseudomonas aeruginosa]|uniref:aldehyde dehydrogenase (NADP(+)) n=1 Tax=Pseudomonas aeruginosa TaxID=287 RepID=UPI0010522740|nr:aldehyde dehydrogenase (NADP(+)) [Pseudomonas aeruginosa]